VLQVVDVSHATDKDVRSLFALDSLKKKQRPDLRDDIHAPRISSYYGDITGPAELDVINRSEQQIASFIEQMQPNMGESFGSVSPSTFEMMSSAAVSPSDLSVVDRSMESSSSRPTSLVKQLLTRNAPSILHVSHYSFEWVVNVNDSIFHRGRGSRYGADGSNHYLVGSYQKTQYDRKMVNEFITMGLTHNIPHREDQFRFFVDDLNEDLIAIQKDTEWVVRGGCSLPDDIWMVVTQFTVDAILPVQVAVGAQSFARCCCTNGIHGHQKDGHCEVTLDDDGSLHLMLTGVLKEKFRESAGGALSQWVKAMGRIFRDFGQIIERNYNPRRWDLKSEYNRWKKEGYKKRPKLPSMHGLSEQLKEHQSLKHDGRCGERMPSLYFFNPNFRLKVDRSPRRSTPRPKAKSSTIHRSIKKLFSFGSGSASSSKSSSQHSSRKNSSAASAKRASGQNDVPSLAAQCELSSIMESAARSTQRTAAAPGMRESAGTTATRLLFAQRPKGITKASTVPIPSTTTSISMSGSSCTADEFPSVAANDGGSCSGHRMRQHLRGSKRYSLSEDNDDWMPSHDAPTKRTSCPTNTTVNSRPSAATVRYSKRSRLKMRYSHHDTAKGDANRLISLKTTTPQHSISATTRDSSRSLSVEEDDAKLPVMQMLSAMTIPRANRVSLSSSCSDTPKSYYLRQEYISSLFVDRRLQSTPRVEEEPDEASTDNANHNELQPTEDHKEGAASNPRAAMMRKEM